jgi:hypothetical protein
VLVVNAGGAGSSPDGEPQKYKNLKNREKSRKLKKNALFLPTLGT